MASGKNLLAEEILDLARKHNITIHTDEELAKSLEKLSVGDEIPEELYTAVAEIFELYIFYGR